MKGFDVLKVKSAVKTHNEFDLSRTHLTTMDFGQIVPLLAEETVPGDKFSINGEYFSRMAPLVKPTYGRFQFKTVQAFVPYHQIAVDSDAWLAGKTTWEGQTPHHRYFTVEGLHMFAKNFCVDTAPSVTPSSANCDYHYIDSAGADKYIVFTPAGKYWVKVLNALGYALPQGVDERTTSSWYTSVKPTKLSAYPLLAFAKLYNDYMSQSQRYNSSPLTATLYSIKYGISTSGFYPALGELSFNVIHAILSNIVLNYENDYFVSAWQSPNTPLNGQESINSVGLPTMVANGMYSTSTNQEVRLPVQSNQVLIQQRALDFLKSFDDWVRRNNYSGSRAVQQVYSRFGIKTDDYKSHYAQIVSTDSMPVQVGDVTAMSDSYNSPLGDYAGKGIMSGSKGFEIQVSDYGMIFVLGYFTVTPMNAFGFDRKVLRNAPLDYYNPEFDGLGADAISLGEVFASPIADSGDTTLDNQVFGYTERYNAYRYGRDQITGEFRNYHKNGDMNTWHTGRNLADVRKAGGLVAQSSSVNSLPQTGSEYNRIFSVMSDSVDHFYMTARFNVSAIRPMLNLNQVPQLGEGDTVVPRNGNVIS